MNYLTLNTSYGKNSFLQATEPPKLHFNDNNNQTPEKTIHEVWSKYNFESSNVTVGVKSVKTSWATEKIEEVKVDDYEEEEEEAPKEKEEDVSPSHHARRPMNAFLIFCKKHRPIVREKFPNLENRGVTRILGEWWALLDDEDKAPYTGLAKEYKDAFLSANPGFKWYKLPAPPLRTLAIRPAPPKPSSPLSSPGHLTSEFTPGKLADESQLGSLTSLLNNNNNSLFMTKVREDNNNTIEKPSPDFIDPSLPLKPFKKRIFDTLDNNNISSHMTNQDLMEKVVEKIFTKPDYEETRKSVRQCKGKRYEKFMVEGRLLGHKRDPKLAFQRPEHELIKLERTDELPNLDNTIKRLAERTNVKLERPNDERLRGGGGGGESTQENAFNLNLRINNLPSLSYEVFHQRKRDSKKRKTKIKAEEPKEKVSKVEKNDQLVGSKKRKNKLRITHLKEEVSVGCDLLALATLAEIAANTEKINSE